jgi:MIP family channel proteins
LYNLAQKLVVEFIGTFAVVLISCGAICTDAYMTASSKPGLAPLGVAAAYGIAVATMIAALGHISGGHYNPAVTIGLWVTRRLGTLSTLFYWAAQIVGAIAAAYTLRAILPDAVWQAAALGTPALAADVTRTHAMLLEGITAALWVIVYFASAVDMEGASRKAAGFVTGGAVAISALFAYPFTGAAMNPARAFAPALASRHWGDHGVYWVGPLFGGLIAGFLYDRIFLRNQPPA